MITIGIIGTGGMAHGHAEAYAKMKGVNITCCCDVDTGRVGAYAAKFNIPRTYTDYREMLAAEKLDGISNVTIDRFHAEISIAALKRDIAVLCEKPLAATLAQARRMRDGAKKAGVANMVNFSYRNSSALQEAARRIKNGAIGTIIHVEASYLQSWIASSCWGDWRTEPAWTWRLSTRHGSNGTLGDIGCHIYDMTTLLCGDIAEVYCRLKTFDKGIRGNRIGEYVLDANDSFAADVSFANGALGTVHATRWATGHTNSLLVRVYGDKGGIEVDLDKSRSQFSFCPAKTNKWESVECKPTPTNYERFVRWIKTGKSDTPDFSVGARVQAYLESSLDSAVKNAPVRVKG